MKISCVNHFTNRPYGGPRESRTPDPYLARVVLSQLSYGPIKTGLLSIKHPIGSEFHIITHNGSLHLTTIGVIIVATLGVFLLPPIVVYLINPIGLHYLISIGYISVSLPLTGLTAVISLIEIKLFDLYYPCLRNSTYPRSALRSQTTHLFLNYYWRFSEHLFVWSRICSCYRCYWYLLWESNSQHLEFESSVSANWTKEAYAAKAADYLCPHWKLLH